MPNETQRPIVFISYSHDSPDHKLQILGLAAALARDGCDCRLDVHKNTEEDWPTWMTKQLTEADFVLCICTQTYEERFRGGSPPDVGLGVGWEAGLLRRLLYRRKLLNARILPVVYNPEDSKFIPLELAGYDYFILENEAGYVSLLRRLHGRAEFVRPREGTAPYLESHHIEPAFARPPLSASDTPPMPEGGRDSEGSKRRGQVVNVSGPVSGDNVVIGGQQTVHGPFTITSARAAPGQAARMLAENEMGLLIIQLAAVPAEECVQKNDLRLTLGDIADEAARTPIDLNRLRSRARLFQQMAASCQSASVQQIASKVAALVASVDSET